MRNSQSELIFKSRYAISEEETWEQCCRRVATSIASVEKDSEKWTELFFNMIHDQLFIPGGRILRNAGKPQTNLLNCVGLTCEDSIEDIAGTLKEAVIISAEGAGIGINFNVRPKGASIVRKGGVSSGVISFMTWFNEITKVVETGGNRRGALLGFIKIDHPEIYDFIRVKSDEGKLNSFNLSVAITHEFLDAVEQDLDWPLAFGGHTYQIVKARELWTTILEHMVKHAEPCLLNFTNMSINNSYYCAPIVTVNGCAEINLERYGACDLGSLNLPKFVTGERTSWKLLEETIPIAVRFLDNVLDVTSYPLLEIKQTAQNLRRLGIGTMGLADMLFEKKIRYGSAESIKEIDKLFSTIRDFAYEASIELAVEKGSFPKYDPVNLSKAKFIRKLPRHLQRGIKEKGIRNVTLLAIPPTGTTSLLAGATSSIEPLFAKCYKRADRISERIYIHPLLKELLKKGEDIPDWFVSTEDITSYEHLEVQCTVQRYVDSAISKTLNLPEGTTVEELNKMVLTYIRDLKGLTVYVDNSRAEQVLNRISIEEARKHLDDAEEGADEETVKCSTGGTCEI